MRPTETTTSETRPHVLVATVMSTQGIRVASSPFSPPAVWTDRRDSRRTMAVLCQALVEARKKVCRTCGSEPSRWSAARAGFPESRKRTNRRGLQLLQGPGPGLVWQRQCIPEKPNGGKPGYIHPTPCVLSPPSSHPPASWPRLDSTRIRRLEKRLPKIRGRALCATQPLSTACDCMPRTAFHPDNRLMTSKSCPAPAPTRD